MWHLFFMGVYRENQKCEARALQSRAIFEDKAVNYEVIYAINRCCVEIISPLTLPQKPLKLISNISKKEVHPMNRFEYIVESIDGDYAHLRRTDIESDELKLVARALLPPEIMEGTKLLYEWMQYSIME